MYSMKLEKPREINKSFSAIYFSIYLSKLYSLSKNEQETDIHHPFCKGLFTSCRSELKALKELDWLFLTNLLPWPLEVEIDILSRDIEFYIGGYLPMWLRPLEGELFIQNSKGDTKYYNIRDEKLIQKIDLVVDLSPYENLELW